MVDDCSLAHGGVQPNKAQTGSHHLLMGHAYGDDIGLAEQMETTAAGGGIGGGGGAGAASHGAAAARARTRRSRAGRR